VRFVLKLENTAVGSVHREEVDRIIAKYRRDLADLTEKIDRLKANSASIRRDLEQEKIQRQQYLSRVLVFLREAWA
jgi:hypothetical protein